MNTDSLEKYSRITDYLSVAQIFLRDNFLLERPLAREHIKPRLLGHWGTCPGINLVYAHTNALIVEHSEREFLYVVGPGHGFPAYQANVFLEGSLSALYPERIPYTRAGVEEICREFSAPYGYPSHLNPEAPGVVLEGGELGYSLAVAYGTVLDNPDLITVCLVGDGEAETGPLSAAWNANRFVSPKTDGAVLPVLHLNGYKISGPTVFGRMTDKEITQFFQAHGYEPLIVDSETDAVHERAREVFEQAYVRIRELQARARQGGEEIIAPHWPVIVLKTPKGMGGIEKLDGETVEGTHIAHQVVFTDLHSNPTHIQALEAWLRSYTIHELISFDADDTLVLDPAVRAVVPHSDRAIGRSRHAHGGARCELQLPEITSAFCDFEKKSCLTTDSMTTLGEYLRDVLTQNSSEPNAFRLFSPDETYSNHLDPLFQATDRAWQWPREPWDTDLAPGGAVVELLSEHTLFGMLWGYTLTGRHGIFASYEAFAQIVASMADQYIKFVKVAARTDFRAPTPSLNIILSSLLERQDHNGFSHQNPSFIASMLDRDLEHVNLYFPADKNMALHAMREALQSRDQLNVIVAGKRMARNWLSREEALQLAHDGLMTWDFLSDTEPDIVVATCGDYITEEAAIGVKLFRELMPGVRVRFVNIFRLDMLAEAPHMPESRDLVEHHLTAQCPLVVNFHGYPATMKKLLFDHHLSERCIVNGYEEEGSTTSPFDMLSRSGLSRFHLVKDLAWHAKAIGRITTMQCRELCEQMDEKLAWERAYITRHDVDPDEIRNWEL